MRSFLISAVLALATAAAAATPLDVQHRAPPAPAGAAPDFRAADGRSVVAQSATYEVTEASPLELREEAGATSATAVLDEAFWRQVLAGVVVTVVSTLILRAIL
jgi:hypothetical protein